MNMSDAVLGSMLMPSLQALRVLYMEDDVGLARLLQRRLTRAGYHVDIAPDGDQGLSMYESASYEVVLLDQDMPGKTGLEVIRLLSSRGFPPCMIMLTGAGNEVIAVEALKRGASDYVIKDAEGRYLELIQVVIEQAFEKWQLFREKRLAEERLARESRVNSALGSLSLLLLSDSPPVETVARAVLEKAKELTGSRQGFVSQVRPESWGQEGSTLDRVTGDDLGMGDAPHRAFPTQTSGRQQVGWEHDLDIREPFYTNFTAMGQGRRGGPDNPIPIENFLSVPILFGQELVGRIALANAKHDYTDDDLHAIEKLAACHALAVKSKRSQDALEASRASFNSIVERSADGIVVTDAKGKILYANSAARGFLDCGEGGFDFFRLIRQAGTGRLTEVGITLPNGNPGVSEMWLDETHWNGKPAYLAVLRNITKRKDAERAIGVSEQRYRALFEQCVDAIAILSTGGKLIDVNGAFLRLLGCTDRKEAIGKRVQGFFLPGNEWPLLCERLGNDGYIQELEVKLRRHDGREVDTLLTISPRRNSKGEVVAYQSIVRDVTEKRRLEGRLRQAQKMEALGRLAGGVAHDFKNLLQVILGSTEVALGAVDEKSEVRKWLSQSFDAGVRAAELVKQILSFCRQEQLKKTILDVTPVVQETVKFLRTSLPPHIRVQVLLEPDLGLVYADATQLHQVVMNLCANAVHAMRESGGVLHLHAATVEIGSDEMDPPPGVSSGAYVKVSVRDTGPGIPNEIQDRLFEPYFTTKKQGEGIGLGLAVAHGIIQSHGGAISVQSNTGRGALFHVYLPVVDSSQAWGNSAE